jgi:glutathione peroxidase
VSDLATLHALSYTSNTGQEVGLAQYAGRPVLVVNTARHCGFAPQYATLQALHEEYGPRGLVVLGFPCDQFAHQEPGGDEQIASECKVNFGVSFPLSTKVDVNGSGTHPVFAFLKERASGLLGARIKWNFTKFLVAPDGATVTRFAPQKDPKELAPLIEAMLAAVPQPGGGPADSSTPTS